VKLFNECHASYTFNINPYPIAVNTTGGDDCTPPNLVTSGQNVTSGRPQAFVMGILHLF
jgi:hypothetical protein